MSRDNLLRDVKFVKLVSVSDLPHAEQIQLALRQQRVGSVIINDERHQARPPAERASAAPPPEGFRIEVPEPLLEKARTVLAALRKQDLA